MLWITLGCTAHDWPNPAAPAAWDSSDTVETQSDSPVDSAVDSGGEAESTCDGSPGFVTVEGGPWNGVGMLKRWICANDSSGLQHCWQPEDGGYVGTEPMATLNGACGVGIDGDGYCLTLFDGIQEVAVGPLRDISESAGGFRCWVDDDGKTACSVDDVGPQDWELPYGMDEVDAAQVDTFLMVSGMYPVIKYLMYAELLTTDGTIEVYNAYAGGLDGDPIAGNFAGAAFANYDDEYMYGIEPVVAAWSEGGEMTVLASDPKTVQADSSERFVDAAVLGSWVCGLTTEGRIDCWDADPDGRWQDRLDWVTANMPADRTFTAIAGSFSDEDGYLCTARICATDTTGDLSCWGYVDDLPTSL